jgi:hypothetical protein
VAAPPTFPLNPPATQYSLYTTLVNSSGKETVFSFIPPHGRRLAVNEQITVAGNMVDRLAVKTSNRQFKAMERAVAAGLLTIVYTPAQYIYDGGATVQVVGMAAGALGMVDPIYFVPNLPVGTPPEFPDSDEERATRAAPARR